MFPRIALVGSILVTLSATVLESQDTIPVAAGTRIRVWAPDHGIQETAGVVARIGLDTLYLHGDGSSYAIPKAVITRIEVSAGRRGAAPLLGGLLGLLGGAAIGVGYGAAGHPGLPHVGGDLPSEVEYLVPFSLIGVVGGAILGSRAQERWRPGRLP